MRTINIITLGCSKNTVDSELLAGQLIPSGWEVRFDTPEKADIVVINTCGFINDAKEESIEAILSFARARQLGEIQRLIVMGCLSQRYREELREEVPEVDGWYGVAEIQQIVADFEIEWRRDLILQRSLSTPPHYAYVKIAEGCDKRCSFCIIPMIRGAHVSRSMEAISAECKELVKKGVKELLLISQDLTYYGKDRYGSYQLATLVERLAKENPNTWIRLHYTFPLGFTDELIEVIARHDNVVNYIDIPLQHISSRILRSMKRGVDREKTVALVEKFRAKIPHVAIRTSFIVGYPGETQEDFEELKAFVLAHKFERMGVFIYSSEEDTFAGDQLKDDVPEEVKNQRREELMDLQQTISLAHNQSLVGKEMTILVDRLEGDYWVGRTPFDSPEVDNEVLIATVDSAATGLEGTFVRVKILSADDYDLYAKPVER
ncbi:MAG: 30S ribosomal protein S12 methylthiotransferase RimO [Bacteroidetes bacterium]|nr:MAG: 30S ribosomal protein S12 methylthiotransferase RimO [Bacteroidota bacterium]